MSETQYCSLDFHETREVPKNMLKPLIDLKFGQVAQSESIKALRYIGECATKKYEKLTQ